jgi:transcriptional regulator with XRE-family HTH domain
MNENQLFGAAVVIIRVARNISRKHLAERAGISYPYISEIEKGTKHPSWAVTMRICNALQISPVRLMAFAEQIKAGGDVTIPAPLKDDEEVTIPVSFFVQ